MVKFLRCRDCGKLFPFTDGEQEYYKKHSLKTPTHCRPCREEIKRAIEDYIEEEKYLPASREVLSVFYDHSGMKRGYSRVYYACHTVGGFR